MDVIEPGIPTVVAATGRREPAAADAAAGHHDHRHRAARRSSSSGAGFTVGGMAKGAAMLAPDMATMLAVLTTDAAVEPGTRGRRPARPWWPTRSTP